jgi:hypothetical protein
VKRFAEAGATVTARARASCLFYDGRLED